MKKFTTLILIAVCFWGCYAVSSCTTQRNIANIANYNYQRYQFDNGPDFVCDGVYRIIDADGRIGYASEDGQIIITPKFAFGFPFENGIAKVTDSGHPEDVEGSDGEYHIWVSDSWYFIDKSGNKVTP